jgi:hypothetical protein
MRTTLLLVTLAFTASFACGQTWIEDGDAPDLLPGQTTTGPGTITTISGTLDSGSDVDLFAIQIDDPATFSAQTCGGTSIDSALYLFDASGNGVAMSEDACGTQSWITDQFVNTTGIYYVAMTAYDYDPLNDGGLDIWNDSPWDEERAPDGPGAPGPLAGWGGSAGGSGTYNIYLTGASFAEYGDPPATGACCFQDGGCDVVTENACVGLGGTYQGDDTTCDPNPCPQPATGACCFNTGGCLEFTEAVCSSSGGTYLGDDTRCWPNPCGDPGEPGWQDDFDDYDAGTILFDVGGWSGWDGVQSAAGLVSAEQARSAPHSIAVKQPADAVHPFVGVQGGQWTITAWQYIPSNLTGTTFFVVNSYYQHGGPQYWAVEIQFDPTSGQIHDQLRDPDATTTLPIIYDQWVEIRIEADLDDGLGYIEQYYNDQLLYSGDWITGSIGQLAIGAIDLYAPHAETVYYDDLSLVPVTEPQNPTRPLFAGVEYGDLPTRTTDLSDYPDVTWNNGFTIPVSGAAARPDGAIYLCNGAFNSELYIAPVEGPPIFLTDLAEDCSGLAYGRGNLYGYSNYASPLGIYRINPATGDMTLVVDTAGKRFFALDYNPADGLLYGYTEYGSPTGLYSIDIDTGLMTHVANPTPASNSSARGMACGYNKVYLISVYGVDGLPVYVYDLAQGPFGTYESITHPFPTSNSTSGAAFAPGKVTGDMNCDGIISAADIDGFVIALTGGEAGFFAAAPDCFFLNADTNDDGQVSPADIDMFVILLTGG